MKPLADVAVLTPTGARPEAFAACCEWMRRQAYRGKVLWVVVDDGPDAMEVTSGWEVAHLRPQPYWTGANTLARNILCGLDHIEAAGIDRIVVVEDDDEYAPWWVERCVGRLDRDDLIGEAPSLYRHKNGAEKNMGNRQHASLCSTALRGPAIGALRKACHGGASGIDMRLWRAFSGSKRIYPPEPRGVVGIKGWPGRPGIGVGHRL